MLRLQVLMLVVIGLLFTGCYSEKILRTKPTTFIDMLDKQSKSKELKYICVNYDEKLYTEVSEVKENVCQGYITLSAQNIKTAYQNDISTLTSDLFYISDMNCRKYVERFKYNYIKQDVAGKFLNLNIFGIGFNIGTIGDLANEQFVQLSDTLNENLNKRDDIKEKILKKTTAKKKPSINELLVDFVEYDRTCSLVNTF